MTSPELPFSCLAPGGLTLRGVLTPAAAPARRVGVLLLNSGLLPRYGYHRHYVKGARALAAAGYTVLRVDLPGIGESDGDFDEAPVQACWRSIQGGALVPAALAAAAALRREQGLHALVLAGACGGAITALLGCAEGADLVDACLAISLPVLLSQAPEPGSPLTPAPASQAGATPPPESQAEAAAPLHPRAAERLALQYLHKALSPRAWLRLLRGRTDFATLRASLLLTVQRRAELLGRRFGLGRPRLHPRGNPRVLPAVEALASRRVPWLLILGGIDPDTDDFDRHLYEPFLAPEPQLMRSLRIERIPRADHTFAQPEDEARLWTLVAQWLEQTLPGDGPARRP